MSEKNKALVQNWIEAGWNKRRDSAIEDFCAEDFAGQDSRQGPLWGHDGIGQLMANILIAFPDLKVRVDDVVAEGNLVACRTTSTGTHRADFLGAPATGKVVSIASIIHFRIENGRISQSWRVWDAYGVLKSLNSPEELKGGLGFAPEIRQTPSAETELNRAALRCLLDSLWNQGKIDVSKTLLADDFVLRDPNMTSSYSADQWRIRIAEIGQAFSNARFEILSLIAEGDAVACRFRFDALQGGEWMGFPPTGTTISTDGAMIARMSLGRCIALWQLRDELGVYQQLQGAQPIVRAASSRL